MSGIYRGPGGTGDAVNDASSETRLAVEARDAAIAAKVAAEAARDAALTAETNAELAETNAETAEANAEAAQAAAEAASINPASIAITGGSINGTTVGASTASTGAFTTLSASGAFSANGGTTLGDASGDALTINSSAVSIPNGLNFDSNTLVIDATNNRVGVGTSSPAAKLDITSSTALSARITGPANAYFDLTDGTGTFRAQLLSNTPFLTSMGAYDFTFGTNNTERMRITSAGNVGIGTSSPSNKLHVVSAGTDVASFDGAANAFVSFKGSGFVEGIIQCGGEFAIGSTNNYPVVIRTNNTERMRIDSSGNLLVGTTSSSGSTSNNALLSVGQARTADGTVSATTATATTIFSITAANRGRYEVMAAIVNSGNAALYTAIATVIWDGSTGRIVANNGTNLTITLSGSDVQITQIAGSTQTVYWSFFRIGLVA